MCRLVGASASACGYALEYVAWAEMTAVAPVESVGVLGQRPSRNKLWPLASRTYLCRIRLRLWCCATAHTRSRLVAATAAAAAAATNDDVRQRCLSVRRILVTRVMMTKHVFNLVHRVRLAVTECLKEREKGTAQVGSPSSCAHDAVSNRASAGGVCAHTKICVAGYVCPYECALMRVRGLFRCTTGESAPLCCLFTLLLMCAMDRTIVIALN